MGDWKVWLKGLIAAVIGGIANSITLMITDPLNYNLQDPVQRTKLLWFAVVSAIISAALYLKQSPLPNGGEQK
jgi:hypothetical protein